MSRFISCDVLKELGELHYGRKRVQPASQSIRAFYDSAGDRLKFPLLTFGAAEVRAIADAFHDVIKECRYTCYACVIMPDHVHLLIRKHRDFAEEMIFNLQEASRLRLRTLGLRDVDHPVWGGCGWKVFLDHPDDIRRTVNYIDDNPLKMRLPRQTYDFVTPYDGWPLHPGHDPNSPYAKRLRGNRHP
jgi:REP element-mobilizing transposase RayT